MIKQILHALLILFLFASCENRYRKGNLSSTNQSVDSKFIGKTTDDTYQVSQSEYDDNFVSRYGLLYLKSSTDPFTGRILTVGTGESGEYVSSDESWKNGRKNGKSSKWFSNGIKMYERNYREGRWHGSVTRWWPNGQKMYVRAYTNGVRHGNEATWRSDGTPLSLPPEGSTPSMDRISPETEDEVENFPIAEQKDESFGQEITEEADGIEFQSLDSPADESLPSFTDPEPPIEIEDTGFSDLPSFPPMEEDPSAQDLPLESPESTSFTNDLPAVPEPVDIPEEVPPLGELPSSDDSGMPDLPGLDSTDTVNEEPIPPLPDLPDSGGLPPLPGMEDSGALPPLPGGEDAGLGDLPPLPPLP
jgi:hypothetical protein